MLTKENIELNQIYLKEVTGATVRSIIKLSVAESQKHLVSPNAVSISEAYFSDTAWFRAIYYKEEPVGFTMLDKAEYYLWRFMIDSRFQGLGIGFKALELIVDYVKTKPTATKIYTSCVPGEGSPDTFYKKFGFIATGDSDDGEDLYLLKL